jgi:hypothetical protein
MRLRRLLNRLFGRKFRSEPQNNFIAITRLSYRNQHFEVVE